MTKRGVKRKESDFVLDLEHNALSSLLHGIEHYATALSLINARLSRPHRLIIDNLKFSIIHVFHALELFLKARLANAHPLLIYLNPENNLDENAYTLSFKALLGRLNNIGVKFTKEDKDDLDALRRMRNSIEHHRIQKKIDDVRLYIGRAARFLERFLNDELDIILKDEILKEDGIEGEDTYRILSEAIHSYEERLKRAKEELEKNLPIKPKDKLLYENIICDSCGEEMILIPDDRYDENKAKCYFCLEEYYYEHCSRCGQPILSYAQLKEADYNPCRDCWEAIMSSDKY